MQNGSIDNVNDFVETTILSMFSIFQTQDIFSSSTRQAKSKSVNKVYGKSGNMNSGYFNPSPIFELFVGNAKRGKLIKRPPENLLDFVEYNLDEDGMITYLTIYTELIDVIDEESFIKQNNMIFSVYFTNPSKRGYASSVTSITRCVFDDLDQLVQYDVLTLAPWFSLHDQLPFTLQKTFELTNELRTECYKYHEGKLSNLELLTFYPHVGFPPRYEVVSFQTDSNNEIVNYDVFNTLSKRVHSYQPKKPYHVRRPIRSNLFKIKSHV